MTVVVVVEVYNDITTHHHKPAYLGDLPGDYLKICSLPCPQNSDYWELRCGTNQCRPPLSLLCLLLPQHRPHCHSSPGRVPLAPLGTTYGSGQGVIEFCKSDRSGVTSAAGVFVCIIARMCCEGGKLYLVVTASLCLCFVEVFTDRLRSDESPGIDKWCSYLHHSFPF